MLRLSIQQIWQERPEISMLSVATLNLCHLGPFDSDEEWNWAIEELETLVNNIKFRISRKVTTLRSRREDYTFLRKQEEHLKESVLQTKKAIEGAKQQLMMSKQNRKNREEYEKMSKEISKRASLSEINIAKDLEYQQKALAEEKANTLQAGIEFRLRQAAIVLQAAEDLKKAIVEPIPGIEG
ncbi:hypothetical protein IE077_001134 [Cardiosporidium cionae]|uniref:Centromere protein H n=1 Tax=Cardiosporidium cionae TaxID=476202 RepID=A0ABQ7JDF8_9APIC|nr:hypothetical protein IE077_001134 [Cardiosporidium cionae]|eukprot:KAF8822066.1 hypothetical protein IE077_001134 [Cardiosporidium cionae]